jgi:hypothetical protein
MPTGTPRRPGLPLSASPRWRPARHAAGWSYWLGAAVSALLVAFAACYAGVAAYNREIERERLTMGTGHFIFPS